MSEPTSIIQHTGAPTPPAPGRTGHNRMVAQTATRTAAQAVTSYDAWQLNGRFLSCWRVSTSNTYGIPKRRSCFIV